MTKTISFLTFSFENKTKKVTMNYFIKAGSFYNISNYESSELLTPAKTHIIVDGITFNEQWHILSLPKDTIIKQEVVVMNKDKNRNRKFIKYFIVTEKENADYYYGVFGPVKEIVFKSK